MKLLLIEDDATMLTTLARTLGRRGMNVATCADGSQALLTWRTFQPDVVTLDLTLPVMDGLQVLGQARAAGLTAPVLILTARGTVGDRITGLNSGADDYLPKPFDLDELEARIRALSRRPGPAVAGAEPVESSQRLGHLEFDRRNGAIYVGGEILDLTPRESALMQALMNRPGHAVSKERLFELVFPGEMDVQYEAIEVVVYRLRKKITGTGVQLVTLRGLGYLLKADA